MSKSRYLMLKNDPIMEFNFDEQTFDENTKSLQIQGTEIPVERIYGIDFL